MRIYHIILSNRFIKYPLIILSLLGSIYVFLRLTFVPSEPVLPFFGPVTALYLGIIENITDWGLRITNSGMTIRNHEFVFLNDKGSYPDAYINLIEKTGNLPKYLLVEFKKWSAIIVFMIWTIISPLKNKIQCSLVFLLLHMLSIITELFLIGAVLPGIIDSKARFIPNPGFMGTSFIFLFLIVWIKLNQNGINNTLKRHKLDIQFTDRKINEIIVVLILLLLLTEFIIPYFEFMRYIHILLQITRRILLFFNYDGYIEGNLLVGANNSILVSKVCLGFKTMFIFGSLVYLTRPNEAQRITWIFISAGMVLLLLLNITRLILLFIVVQGENGIERAVNHHEVYNMAIYITIIIMWVFWYEFYIRTKAHNKNKNLHP